MENKHGKTPFFYLRQEHANEVKHLLKKDIVKIKKDSKFTPADCVFHINNNFLRVNDIDDRFKLKGFATPGSLMIIDGKMKSRKTTFATMMVAAFFKEDGVYENIVCSINPNKHVIIFDTEQTRSEFKVKTSALSKWCQDEDLEDRDNFHAISLQSLGHDPISKVRAIDMCVSEIEESFRDKNGVIKEDDQIGMIVVDHVGDLVNGLNIEEEANDVIGFLQDVGVRTGALIVCVIHQNKTDNKAAGKLGNQLGKKATSYLKTFKSNNDDKDEMDNTKEDEFMPTEIWMFENRFGGKLFKRFLYNYDDYGFPVVLDENQLNYKFKGKSG